MKLTPADLYALFKLEPKAAIAYLERKQLDIRWNWFDALGGEIHDRIFTVAKVARLDILQDIKDGLKDALATGSTERDFIANLEPILRAKGWWGRAIVVDSQGQAEAVQQGSPYRLKTLYQTNMQSAMMQGRHAAMLEAVDSHPWWQIVGVDDGRTRPAHRAMHGRVYRYDDPLMVAIGAPPWGFNCRCRLRPLSDRGLVREGLEPSSSAGKLRTIEVEAGADKRTGEIIMVKRTGVIDVPNKLGGEPLFFAPDAGFGRGDWKQNPADYDRQIGKLLHRGT
jgi:SPP1 gp7 family putative phage head morphogenesis protein